MKLNLTRKSPKTKYYETEFSSLHKFFLNLPNIQIPLKMKLFRGNNSPFKTKALRKTVMIESRLNNCFNKTKSDKNWSLYKTQRNF